MGGAEEQHELEQAIADVEERFGILFGRVRLVWKEAAASIHPELQPVGYRILSSITRLGETNAYVLAELLETDKSIVSRQLKMLEDAKLITSRPDARDGRVRVLSPTPEAVERVKAARAQQQDRLRGVLRGQPLHEVRVFAEMLKLLSEV